MATEKDILRNRFLHAIWYVDIFLKLTGVDLVYRQEKRLYKALRWIWSGLWLLLDAQSGIFITIRKNTLEKLIELFSSSAQLLIEGKLMDHLNDALMRLSDLFFEMFTHYVLVLTIRATLGRFFDALEPIDSRLNRPNLSSIRIHSIVGLIFTAWIIGLNMGFALVWIDIAKQDHVGQNGTNYDWMLLIEIVIWKLNTSFALMAVWLFALCGHLLVLYHKQMAEELKGLANSNRIRNRERVDNDELWSFLSHFESLCEAKRELFKDFRSMLIMNCCLSATNILACSYFSINLILSSTAYLMVTWDISDILEFTFRLWLICHTADIIRSSATECIPILRELREQMASTSDRRKVTCFIVEMSQWSSQQNDIKDVEGLNLFGMLSINKRLTLQVWQAVVMMVITIFQFKHLAQ